LIADFSRLTKDIRKEMEVLNTSLLYSNGFAVFKIVEIRMREQYAQKKEHRFRYTKDKFGTRSNALTVNGN
jgi:hypothetical protein